jgi:hypothetical protein
MDRAQDTLQNLVGESVEALTVNSLTSDDAPFLAQIVSKLSPMIGNLLERRIIQVLAEEAENNYSWIRQDPGFPDAALLDASGSITDSGFEVKAWYAFSTELTGRFRESRNLLAGKDVRLVVVAWAMSHVVYGTPQILGVVSIPADDVANSRDRHYFTPPRYVTVEPNDTTNRTRNLQQSNVNGYRLQDPSERKLQSAEDWVKEVGLHEMQPHSIEAQKLVAKLVSDFNYRLDTNFAKIDRIENAEIEQFKRHVLNQEFRDRKISDWTKLLKSLNSDAESAQYKAASSTIKNLYGEL